MVLRILPADREPEVLPDVHGKRPSRPEWRLAVALADNGWEFEFQVGIAGGRRVKGGQVIDFVVTNRFPQTIIHVDGAYRHGAADKRDSDNFKRALIADRYGMNAIQLQVFDFELADLRMANAWVRENLGRRN